MSMSVNYRPNWENNTIYFVKKSGFATLRSKAHQGLIGKLGIRTNAWKVFLGIFPEKEDQNTWLRIIKNSREKYSKLKNDFKITDPLIDSNNIQKIRLDITKDVRRTFQNYSFFLNFSVQEEVTTLLSIWASTHSLGYLQGMSDLAAVIYYQVWLDKCPDPTSVFFELNSPEHIESDTFLIFSRLFEVGMQNMYMQESKERPKHLITGLFEDLNPYSREDIQTNPVIKTCHNVYELYLQHLDPELYAYLQDNSIESHLFLLRWFRCLFSREFTLNNALVVWDFFFSYVGVSISCALGSIVEDIDVSRDLYMIEFFALACIIFIRDQLTDPSKILNVLTSYPECSDVIKIVSLAIKCKDFLAVGQESLRPKLAQLNVKYNPSFRKFNSLKSEKTVTNKKKRFSLIGKASERKSVTSADSGFFSSSSFRDHSNIYDDPCIALLDRIKLLISDQMKTKKLNKDKIRESLSCLEELKMQICHHC